MPWKGGNASSPIGCCRLRKLYICRTLFTNMVCVCVCVCMCVCERERGGEREYEYEILLNVASRAFSRGEQNTNFQHFPNQNIFLVKSQRERVRLKLPGFANYLCTILLYQLVCFMSTWLSACILCPCSVCVCCVHVLCVLCSCLCMCILFLSYLFLCLFFFFFFFFTFLFVQLFVSARSLSVCNLCSL